MRRSTLRLGILAALVITVAGVALAENGTPASEPYSVSVKSAPAPNGSSFLVTVIVTDRATGKVVFAPHVQTNPGIPAEIISDPDAAGRTYEAQIAVAPAGKASVTFKAYERIVQRTRVSS